jgi:acetolactate synthase I/II/III large subunit
MTKYAIQVNEPLNIKYHLEKACDLATSGRPGPVWLDIPLNIQSANIEPDELIGWENNLNLLYHLNLK